MAIFDTEKRPRGLRVPSLAAMKSSAAGAKSQFSFHNKKSTESVPSEEAMFTSQSPAFLTTPLPKPSPQPNKELPSPPKEGTSAPSQAPSQTPSDNAYFPPVPSSRNGIPERRPIERVPVPGRSASPRPTGMRNKQSHPDHLNGTHQPPPPVTLSPAPPVPGPGQVPALVEDPLPTTGRFYPDPRQHGAATRSPGNATRGAGPFTLCPTGRGTCGAGLDQDPPRMLPAASCDACGAERVVSDAMHDLS
ncbi:hypothetical protein N7461_002131 [Penicillium sp. DV-2018c]|nr:hypothetical protein N7461_002131 [Penicillium sp. DV-2018c]